MFNYAVKKLNRFDHNGVVGSYNSTKQLEKEDFEIRGVRFGA